MSLDRDLIRTELHHRGIEACDVLDEDGTLIHIKKIDSSEPASHHIAQALVSADALLYDVEAKERAWDGPREGAPTADALFTFT